MDAIERALQHMSVTGETNISAVAKQFECNRSTLSKRYNGKAKSAQDKAESQQLLNASQEQQLLTKIHDLNAQGTPPTTKLLNGLCEEILGRPPGKQWSLRFVARHAHELEWPQSLQHTPKPPPLPHPATPTPTIDFRRGEAIATCEILIELAKHREPPILIMGSQLADRPTINVTLMKALGEDDAECVKREYKTGRSKTVQGRCDQETEHFRFEWVAGRDEE